MEHMNILFTENTFIWLIIAINGDKVKKCLWRTTITCIRNEKCLIKAILNNSAWMRDKASKRNIQEYQEIK